MSSNIYLLVRLHLVHSNNSWTNSFAVLRNFTSTSRIMWNIFSKTGKKNSVPVRGETLTIVSTTCEDKKKNIRRDKEITKQKLALQTLEQTYSHDLHWINMYHLDKNSCLTTFQRWTIIEIIKWLTHTLAKQVILMQNQANRELASTRHLF